MRPYFLLQNFGYSVSQDFFANDSAVERMCNADYKSSMFVHCNLLSGLIISQNFLHRNRGASCDCAPRSARDGTSCRAVGVGRLCRPSDSLRTFGRNAPAWAYEDPPPASRVSSSHWPCKWPPFICNYTINTTLLSSIKKVGCPLPFSRHLHLLFLLDPS